VPRAVRSQALTVLGGVGGVSDEDCSVGDEEKAGFVRSVENAVIWTGLAMREV
jgi:hypothetical protein